MTSPQDSKRAATDEEIRARLREVAQPLFYTNGFSATSSDAIAKAAGISKKTLYRLFESKQALLLAVVRHDMRAIERESDPLYDDHTMDFNKKANVMLEYISQRYAGFASSNVLADFRRTAPDVWREFEHWLIQRRIRFRNVLEDGITQGHIRRDLTADDLLTIYMTVVSHCIEHASLEEGAVTPGEVYSGFMKIFYEGIKLSRTSS